MQNTELIAHIKAFGYYIALEVFASDFAVNGVVPQLFSLLFYCF